MQAIRPNLYSVAYKRNGAYKGMGWLGQGIVQGDGMTASTTPVTGGICPGAPGCPGYVAPVNCPGTPGCPGYVDPDQNLSTAMEALQTSGQYSLISTDALNQLTRASVTQPAPTTTPGWVLPAVAAIAIYFAFTGGRSR